MMDGRNLVHCSFHKCLTAYFARVMGSFFGGLKSGHRGYRHFNSRRDLFHEDLHRYLITSINNHALDLDSLGDFRLSRFIRDPRDLVVSGYHYHRRGAEEWCRIVDPTEQDWLEVNGTRPCGMTPGHSFSSYLQSISEDEGLVAEAEFRKRHFDSMRAWPPSDSRVLTFRYEDVIGNEGAVFAKIFTFYGFHERVAIVVGKIAEQFAISKTKKHDEHVRDPSPGQWRRHFSPQVDAHFQASYPGLIESLGFETDRSMTDERTVAAGRETALPIATSPRCAPEQHWE